MKYIFHKTGVIIMVIALFSMSCTKHSASDICTYPGTKLDQLATKFKGVTELVIDLVVMKDTITQLQKILVTLPETPSTSALKTGLTNINDRNVGISSTITKLANNVTSVKAINDSLKIDLTALTSRVDTDDTTLKTQISKTSPTNIIQLARLNYLLKTNTALSVQITNAQKSLDNLIASSGDTATQVAVDVLRVSMNCAKVSFDILLATYML